MGKFIDLTGLRFGRLTVMKRSNDYISPKGQHKIQWLCKCDCGNDVIVSGSNLNNNSTVSCGCFLMENNKKYNQYDLNGEFGVGYTTKGEEFYFDLEDYDKIKDYCWYINKQGYVVTRNNKKIIKFHRIVFSQYSDVDHIKHKKYDNRKSQLRPVTDSQNMMNRIIGSNNKSGYKGVRWDRQRNKWCAYISINKTRIYLGWFNELEDAVEERKKAEEKYFGEFSYDNSMMSK